MEIAIYLSILMENFNENFGTASDKDLPTPIIQDFFLLMNQINSLNLFICQPTDLNSQMIWYFLLYRNIKK